MKTCCICKEHKPNDEYRTTKKTVDGLYPYCKRCIVMDRIYRRSSLETIILQQWHDIYDLAHSKGAGVVLYTSKNIFIEFVRSSPRFNTLYKQWLTYEYGDMRLECTLKNHDGLFEFDNFKFQLRELKEGESLKVVRYRPVVIT